MPSHRDSYRHAAGNSGCLGAEDTEAERPLSVSQGTFGRIQGNGRDAPFADIASVK